MVLLYMVVRASISGKWTANREKCLQEIKKIVCVEKRIIISFKIYPHKYFNNSETQKLKAQVEKVFTAKAHSVKYLIHSLSHSMEIIITIKLV